MKKVVKYFLSSLVIALSIFSAFPVLAIDNEDVKLQVDIGQSFSPIGDCGQYCAVSWIGEYVKAIYKYGISLAVILSIVMIMVGGFVWLLSAGSPDKVKTAKDFITSSLTGLVLALFSFVILQSINPNLVNLKPLQISVPKEQDITPIAETPVSGQNFDSEVNFGMTLRPSEGVEPEEFTQNFNYPNLYGGGFNQDVTLTPDGDGGWFATWPGISLEGQDLGNFMTIMERQNFSAEPGTPLLDNNNRVHFIRPFGI